MFEEKAFIFHFCLETSFEEQNVKPAWFQKVMRKSRKADWEECGKYDNEKIFGMLKWEGN